MHLSADLAILDLPGQDDYNLCKSTLAKYGLSNGSYINIVPSGLVRHYTPNRAEYISCFVELINRISDMPEFQNMDIVLLAHVVYPSDADDRVIIHEVCSRLSEAVLRRVKLVTDVLQPLTLRQILGNGYLTVTGRMHAAISAIQMGKPAVCLSYSVKYGGVIGKSLGLPELVIESRDIDIWKNGSIVDKIIEKIITLDKNYNPLSDKIRARVSDIKETLENQFKDIMKQIARAN